MSFSPPPPPGFQKPQVGAQASSTSMNFYHPTTPTSQKLFPRRPKVWVPPLIAFGSFAAGYAIPWEFGESPGAVVVRIVFPLSFAAIFCLVAGYYSYRTVPGWRGWTWVAFAAMTLNAVHSFLYAGILTPFMVDLLLWLSVIGLGVAAALGPEKLGDIHVKPRTHSAGDN